MEMFKVDVTLTNPKDPGRWFSEKFWVDRGYTASAPDSGKILPYEEITRLDA